MLPEVAYLANKVKRQFANVALSHNLPLWQNQGMESFNQIKALRRAKGLTIEDLSDRTGLSVSYLSRLENFRRRLNTGAMEKISAALGVPVTELLAEKPAGDRGAEIANWPAVIANAPDEAKQLWSDIKNLKREVSELAAEVRTTYVPLISWVAAGQFSDAATVEQIETAKRIAVDGLGPGDWIALEVLGESMNRVSPDGSIIIVNRADRDLVNKGLYVIATDIGEATYKQYLANPDRFAPMSSVSGFQELPADEFMRVIGRVRKSIVDL